MKVIRIILLILNIFAALGLVATTLAGTIAPSSSIWPSVLAYGFLPLLTLNIAFVLLWLFMGKWQLLISVAAIALRFTFVGAYFQVGGNSDIPPEDEHPGMFTLLSFNLHNFGGNGVQSIPEDSNAIAFLALVREEHPDILCLQEYHPVKGFNVTDSLEYMGYSHYFGAHGSNTKPSGTVVFSKLPITFVKRIDQQKVMVEISQGESRFRLLCVHMDSYSFDVDDRADIELMAHLKIDSTSSRTLLSKAKGTVLRHEEVWNNQLRSLVSESSLPVIFTGDMNDIPSSWLYAQITKYLRDCFRDEGSGFSSTFNDIFLHFRIDMVFHSSEFTTLSYRRIKTSISDHYPILIAFEMNKEN
ncbi:MAG: endonuclease/exonuclease/phosphatase family protein [bacterium]